MAADQTMDGFLVIDKPSGMTSRDVVNRIQQRLPRRHKIGHAGTLDPLATGVLVIAVGKATRLIQFIQDFDKQYRTRIHLGATSTTDDADGDITARSDSTIPTQAEIEAVLQELVGVFDQRPPAYSAILINGQRAYDLARKGRQLDLEARPVRVEAIRILAYDYPKLDLEIDCGKGTYIRSIARDLGEQLGCGAYVETLQRSAIGHFDCAAAHKLDDILQQWPNDLLPPLMGFPHLHHYRATAETIEWIRCGQVVTLAGVSAEQTIAIVNEQGQLMAVGETDEDARFRSTVVLFRHAI